MRCSQSGERAQREEQVKEHSRADEHSAFRNATNGRPLLRKALMTAIR
jgi:hypothetical protein